MAINEERGMYKETWVSLTHQSLEASVQGQEAGEKANGMLAPIARGLENRKRVLLQLDRALVRPQPEYCGQFGSLYLRKDVLAPEGARRRFPRRIPGMEGLTNEERLSGLGLYSLEIRRVRERTHQNQ